MTVSSQVPLSRITWPGTEKSKLVSAPDQECTDPGVLTTCALTPMSAHKSSKFRLYSAGEKCIQTIALVCDQNLIASPSDLSCLGDRYPPLSLTVCKRRREEVIFVFETMEFSERKGFKS